MITAVVDNTVLSNFAHVEKPGLLCEAFDGLAVLRAVIGESWLKGSDWAGCKSSTGVGSPASN